MGAVHVSIETIKSTNMGDHGERLRTSHAQVPGETVEDLVTRVFPELAAKFQTHNPTDEIVLRLIVEPDGKVDADQPIGGTADPWGGAPL